MQIQAVRLGLDGKYGTQGGNFSVQGRVGNKVGHYVSAVLGNPGRMWRRFKAKA